MGDYVANRRVIQDYYSDLNNMVDLLSKLANSYRLLIGGAGELNSIALANKKDVRKAIKRATELGNIIDNIVEVLDEADVAYLNYLGIKNQIISDRMSINVIQTEIDEELRLKE